jgi:hypothetical protein
MSVLEGSSPHDALVVAWRGDQLYVLTHSVLTNFTRLSLLDKIPGFRGLHNAFRRVVHSQISPLSDYTAALDFQSVLDYRSWCWLFIQPISGLHMNSHSATLGQTLPHPPDHLCA